MQLHTPKDHKKSYIYRYPRLVGCKCFDWKWFFFSFRFSFAPWTLELWWIEDEEKKWEKKKHVVCEIECKPSHYNSCDLIPEHPTKTTVKSKHMYVCKGGEKSRSTIINYGLFFYDDVTAKRHQTYRFSVNAISRLPDSTLIEPKPHSFP